MGIGNDWNLMTEAKELAEIKHPTKSLEGVKAWLVQNKSELIRDTGAVVEDIDDVVDEDLNEAFSERKFICTFWFIITP